MTKRLLLVMGLALGLALATTPPAGAQEDDGYPPSVFFLTVSDATPFPGQTIAVSGAMTPGSTSITFTFFSQPVSLGSTTPNPDGSFSSSVTIPSDATLGEHTLSATDSTGLTLSAALNVVSPGDDAADDDEGVTVGVPGAAARGAAGAAGALPRTGDDTSLPLLRVGAVLVAAGGLLLFLTRRRRDEQDKATAAV
jgi:LPXTG-motif cell wall-anchored protein